MMGLMLTVPLLAAIYTIIIAVAAIKDTTPVILTAVQEIIWYVLIGAAVVVAADNGRWLRFGGKIEKRPRLA